ncbi:hypothetical protein niasHS_008099 [Heterodera schachtii]|uniref:BTB domain-containing protein n=1 Tax=Heterodera schachtii TaxID=97005 RepID=A0ABD2JA34_HETSC
MSFSSNSSDDEFTIIDKAQFGHSTSSDDEFEHVKMAEMEQTHKVKTENKNGLAVKRAHCQNGGIAQNSPSPKRHRTNCIDKTPPTPNNSSADEFTIIDQAQFEHSTQSAEEELELARMTELERMNKMNLEKGNADNGQEIDMANPGTLADRMKVLLSTAKGADAHFLVGKCDKKELVHAHKGILMASSKVFEAMFQKDQKNVNDKIGGKSSAEKDGLELLVPDIDAEAFKVMLRFIYADDLSELNGQNVAEVLYAALKFNVIGLVKACADFPISQLSNVFTALSIARLNDLLKDFVQRCLLYIDTNVETLIKSDSFLQIDQKLLCEILEREELQICEEISIWNACRENGIECAAENRRKMLGSALFKIRFPLFSKKEFTEKIVSSSVLTLQEVVGIYQFLCHPNFCGTSDGLLYPLQFPSHWRILTFGTIMMDIEKVSEFAGESVGCCRSSKSVKIKGFPWKIMTRINMKKENAEKLKESREKWRESLEKCKESNAKLRENNGKSKENFEEMMENNEKWKENFEEMMKNAKRLKETGEKILKDGKEIMKEYMETSDMRQKKWEEFKKAMEIARDEKWLGFFLYGGDEASKEDLHLSRKCSATLRILSQKSGVCDFKKKFGGRIFNNKMGNKWGFPNFISFAHLMDPDNGFYNKEEDKMTLAIDLTVTEEKTENP